jgi:hypothetical protein
MRKILFILFLLSVQVSFGQYTSEESNEKTNPLSKLSFKDRLYTGGNIAFNATSISGIPIYFFETSPFVGYKVNPKLSVGVGAKYIYIGSKQATFKYSVYGGNIFSRYKFTESLFAHAEFEVLRAYNLGSNITSQNERATVPMLFAGAGYNYVIGGKLNFQIMLLYDFIDNINSPYQGSFMFGPLGPPIIYRAGISIGM